MGIKSSFRKIMGRPADSFDEIEEMVTRKLPLPEQKKGSYIQFIASRDKNGYWSLSLKSNVSPISIGKNELNGIALSVHNATVKHMGKNEPKIEKMNFDAAFLILKEIEETHLKINNITSPENEPFGHYMAAYRLLPQSFREGLDDLYQSRLGKNVSPSASSKKPPSP